jgi:hypothetical protein
MAKAKRATITAPVPVKTESRICFGIAWYATEAEAMEADRIGRMQGNTYNGGWFHGMPCGRDTTWDHVDQKTGQQLYAVTH